MTSTAISRNPKFVWQSEFIESGITGNPGFVGLLMSTYDNGDGKGLWISQPTISEKTGLSIETVRRCIKVLMGSGWIERTSTGRGGRASTYRLSTPQADATAGSNEEANRASGKANRAAVPDSSGQQCPPIRPPIRPSSIDRYDTQVVVDNRPEWVQQEQYERDNEAEGFDRNGMPIERERRSIFSDGYERRYRSEL